MKGRRIEVDPAEYTANCSQVQATPQFEIDDDRSAAMVADQLRQQGFDPVWKDWDSEILSALPA